MNAPLGMPLPASVDLFGETVEELRISRRKMASLRRELASSRHKLMAEGCKPLEALGYMGMKFMADGDMLHAKECFEAMLPYMYPRLSSVMIPGAGQQGGGLVVSWQTPPAVIEGE